MFESRIFENSGYLTLHWWSTIHSPLLNVQVLRISEVQPSISSDFETKR